MVGLDGKIQTWSFRVGFNIFLNGSRLSVLGIARGVNFVLLVIVVQEIF